TPYRLTWTHLRDTNILPHEVTGLRFGTPQGGRLVRIGFDMLAAQSPHHGHRGIGRYARHLVRAALERDDGHEYVLYVHRDLPTDRIPEATNATTRIIRPAPEHGLVRISQYLD